MKTDHQTVHYTEVQRPNPFWTGVNNWNCSPSVDRIILAECDRESF